MATWTAPVTHATGDVLAVTDWNGLANDATFLYEAPYAMYYNSTATSCGTGATTQVSLGGTTASNYGFSLSSNDAVVPLAGTYMVFFSVYMASTTGSGSDAVYSFVYHNGSQSLEGLTLPSYILQVSTGGGGIVSCSTSDTLGLYLANDSGSTLDTAPGAQSTYLHAAFIGSQ